MVGVRVNFCHLAGSASFDVFCDKCFHVWPPVVLQEELQCLCNPGMAGSHMIMEKRNYPPSKHVVCHDNQGSPVMPVGSVQ